MSDRIFEGDIRLPALYVISLHNGQINTTQLSILLRDLLKPTGEDLEPLKDRSDDYFSQIVRNLTAKTRPFVKNGFIERDSQSGSPLFITPKGLEYLEEHKSELNYLLNNNFQYSDIIKNLKDIETQSRKAHFFDENTFISEGELKQTESEVYQRSKKLRDFAVQHYTVDGKISCACCGFNFSDFYGEDIGKDFIEIHHIKPIFAYEGDDINKTLAEAVKNLVPVCSNCHRMIHRKQTILPVELKTIIEKFGKFVWTKKP
jgi:predicted HNH restriction endonuclease